MERFDSIFMAAPDAIIVIDQSGYILRWNPKAEILFGWTAKEATYRPLSEMIIPQRYREAHQKGMSHFLSTGEGPVLGKTVEIQGLHKNGTEIAIALSISPTIIEGKYMFIGFIRDITGKKLLEKEIREANMTLENKVRQRTLELEQKNKEMEQFAYIASHDLREPLRTISSFAALLKDQYYQKLDGNANQYIDFLTQSSDRMGILIKDLLDYSRLGKSKDLHRIDTYDILEEVLADLDSIIQGNQAAITARHLPVIEGYRTELKLLFQNLLTNAIKFRKRETPPQISIDAEKTDGVWTFSFRDNGIGIEKQHQERIFIIFQRLHTRKEYEGSGIGLAHCKKIVELHGGRIWVESSPGEGSTFFLTLPATTDSP
ncbi:MAG: ATP-binding protein [Puia sp.]|nr:ATP-binding protein [Puia sp.]